VQEVLQNASDMATHDKGNYIMILALDCVAEQKQSTADQLQMWNHYWREFARHLTDDLWQFVHLAQNTFGSFVLNSFLSNNGKKANQMLLERLRQCGMDSQLAEHEYGKFVVRHLCRYADK